MTDVPGNHSPTPEFADFLARDIVREFLDSGKSISRLGEKELLSSLWRRPDGTVIRNELRPRHKEVEEIPSPWLTGTPGRARPSTAILNRRP